jgi:hypothetical protein
MYDPDFMKVPRLQLVGFSIDTTLAFSYTASAENPV